MCFCFGSSSDISDETDDTYFSTLRRDNLSIGSKVIEEAKKNDPGSLFLIGEAYFKAGSEDDKTSTFYKKALYWFQKSADLGSLDSQFTLGYMYENGYVKEDRGLAVEHYFTASAQRYIPAFYKLGYLYEKGIGVEQSDEHAFRWYKKAAEQGDRFSQFKVGMMYKNGTGVDKDCTMALIWLTCCANEGEDDAKLEIKILNAEGHRLENEEEDLKKLSVKKSKISIKNNSILKQLKRDTENEKKQTIQTKRQSRASYTSIVNEKIEPDTIPYSNKESEQTTPLPQSTPTQQKPESNAETKKIRSKSRRIKKKSSLNNKTDDENHENDLVYDDDDSESDDNAENDIYYDEPNEKDGVVKHS